MDVNCGSYLRQYTKSAVQKKKVLESDIDRALSNLFSIRIRLGLFNGDPTKQEFGNIGSDHVCSQKHQDLALEAAKNGIVLLKNSANLLPLSKMKTGSLAVIGPNADSHTLLGNYEGFPCKNVSVLQALQSYANHTIYHQGCNFVNCTDAAIDEVVHLVKEADYAVLIMGLDQTQEREGHDRKDLELPGNQVNLITSVAQAAKSPVILVVMCGGAVDISFAKDNPKIGSILWAGYPGEAGGTALAEIIYGDHNPGGRLPVTWYPKDFIKVPMTDMRMRPEPSTGYPGRTYRFYNGTKVFEFGFGLSYTNYSYSFVSVSQNKIFLNSLLPNKAVQNLGQIRFLSVSELGTKLCDSMKLSVSVRVENQGEMDGKHPVLLFVKWDKLSNRNPLKKLVGFKRVSLSAGKNVEIEFVLNPCDHFSTADEDGLMVIQEGTHYLLVGDKEYPITLHRSPALKFGPPAEVSAGGPLMINVVINGPPADTSAVGRISPAPKGQEFSHTKIKIERQVRSNGVFISHFANVRSGSVLLRAIISDKDFLDCEQSRSEVPRLQLL
ncbi:putative beta-D-xylosidase 7 [Forsythia ovata]|uniref:Beta-D-xylosidase 7 n=1 Tax=Forsythia ovata TaxID=205694 RepID=A0ABD1PZY3_9LAMI